jgi:hypothetical protein
MPIEIARFTQYAQWQPPGDLPEPSGPLEAPDLPPDETPSEPTEVPEAPPEELPPERPTPESQPA